MIEIAYSVPCSPVSNSNQYNKDDSFYDEMILEFQNLLASEVYVDLTKLQKMSRYGIPDQLRGEVWKFLLKTEKCDRSDDMHQLRVREEEYGALYQKHYEEKSKVRGEFLRHQRRLDKALPQIIYENVIGAYLFRNKLAIFNSNWVYMITPFVMTLNNEIDVFFCFNNLLDRIDEHSEVESFGEQITKFKVLFRNNIPDLFEYFEEEQVGFNDWLPSWLRFLLAKELPLECVFPLWDFYFSSPDFVEFHIYFCVAILKHFKDFLEELENSEIKGFLFRLPRLDVFAIRQIAIDLRYKEEDQEASDERAELD